MKGINDMIGISIALLSAIIFNIGFISIRKVSKDINAWVIVFYFTITNMTLSPLCILAENSMI